MLPPLRAVHLSTRRVCLYAESMLQSDVPMISLPSAMTDRIAKVNSLIGQLMATLLQRELSLKPGVFLTIAKVTTTRDLRHCTVSVSVFPESERDYAMQTLRHEHGNLQRALHGELAMKVLPRISFAYDDTESRADVVEHLFRAIAAEEHSDNRPDSQP